MMTISQLQEKANSLGIPGSATSSSQTVLIRSIQKAQGHEPCFATDKRYFCNESCEWRKDCRGLIAAWMR